MFVELVIGCLLIVLVPTTTVASPSSLVVLPCLNTIQCVIDPKTGANVPLRVYYRQEDDTYPDWPLDVQEFTLFQTIYNTQLIVEVKYSETLRNVLGPILTAGMYDVFYWQSIIPLAGLLQNMNQLAAQYDWANQIEPAALATMIDADGNYMAFNERMNVWGLFYHPSDILTYGLPQPQDDWTTQDLFDFCEAARLLVPDKLCIAIGYADLWELQTWWEFKMARECGVTHWDAFLAGEFQVNTDNCTSTVWQEIIYMFRRGYFPSPDHVYQAHLPTYGNTSAWQATNTQSFIDFVLGRSLLINAWGQLYLTATKFHTQNDLACIPFPKSRNVDLPLSETMEFTGTSLWVWPLNAGQTVAGGEFLAFVQNATYQAARITYINGDCTTRKDLRALTTVPLIKQNCDRLYNATNLRTWIDATNPLWAAQGKLDMQALSNDTTSSDAAKLATILQKEENLRVTVLRSQTLPPQFVKGTDGNGHTQITLTCGTINATIYFAASSSGASGLAAIAPALYVAPLVIPPGQTYWISAYAQGALVNRSDVVERSFDGSLQFVTGDLLPWTIGTTDNTGTNLYIAVALALIWVLESLMEHDIILRDRPSSGSASPTPSNRDRDSAGGTKAKASMLGGDNKTKVGNLYLASPYIQPRTIGCFGRIKARLDQWKEEYWTPTYVFTAAVTVCTWTIAWCVMVMTITAMRFPVAYVLQSQGMWGGIFLGVLLVLPTYGLTLYLWKRKHDHVHGPDSQSAAMSGESKTGRGGASIGSAHGSAGPAAPPNGTTFGAKGGGSSDESAGPHRLPPGAQQHPLRSSHTSSGTVVGAASTDAVTTAAPLAAAFAPRVPPSQRATGIELGTSPGSPVTGTTKKLLYETGPMTQRYSGMRAQVITCMRRNEGHLCLTALLFSTYYTVVMLLFAGSIYLPARLSINALWVCLSVVLGAIATGFGLACYYPRQKVNAWLRVFGFVFLMTGGMIANVTCCLASVSWTYDSTLQDNWTAVTTALTNGESNSKYWSVSYGYTSGIVTGLAIDIVTMIVIPFFQTVTIQAFQAMVQKFMAKLTNVTKELAHTVRSYMIERLATANKVTLLQTQLEHLRIAMCLDPVYTDAFMKSGLLDILMRNTNGAALQKDPTATMFDEKTIRGGGSGLGGAAGSFPRSQTPPQPLIRPTDTLPLSASDEIRAWTRCPATHYLISLLAHKQTSGELPIFLHVVNIYKQAVTNAKTPAQILFGLTLADRMNATFLAEDAPCRLNILADDRKAAHARVLKEASACVAGKGTVKMSPALFAVVESKIIYLFNSNIVDKARSSPLYKFGQRLLTLNGIVHTNPAMQSANNALQAIHPFDSGSWLPSTIQMAPELLDDDKTTEMPASHSLFHHAGSSASSAVPHESKLQIALSVQTEDEGTPHRIRHITTGSSTMTTTPTTAASSSSSPVVALPGSVEATTMTASSIAAPTTTSLPSVTSTPVTAILHAN